MATIPMTKVGIIGYSNDSELVLKALQKEGAVHLVPLSEPREESFEIANTLREIDDSTDFLTQFMKEKPKRQILSPQEVSTLLDDFNIVPILDRITYLKTSVEELNTKLSRAKAYLTMLQPWESLDMPLAFIRDTRHTKIRMGVVPAHTFDIFEKEVIEQPLLHWREVKRCREGLYIVILYHKDIAEWLDTFLAKVEFTHWEPKQFNDIPANEIDRLNNEIDSIQHKLDDISKKGEELSKHIVKLWATADHYEQILEQYKALSESTQTQRTFSIQGWIPKKLLSRLKKRMETAFDAIEVMELPTLPEDEPPVALRNPFFIEAFEIITDLYGRPVKGMVDPTPFVAPFFALYFALCLTDAGYGVLMTVIAAAGLIIMKKPSAQKFFRLILFVGILTIFAGIITGGYFGLKLPEQGTATGLAALALKFKLFDPLRDIMTFFVISIAFGIVQLSIGFIVSGYVNFRKVKKSIQKFHSIFVALARVAATIGIGFFVMGYILPEKLGALGQMGTNMLWFGAIAIIVGHGIIGPIAGYKIGACIGNALAFEGLYGLIGVFSDLLSFVRLTALGLSTGIVAGVITNQTLKMKGAFFIAGLIILVCGHIFYCLFSALGAFVHPTRLQFVEFFSKFYESGGKPFEPFRQKYRRIEVI